MLGKIEVNGEGATEDEMVLVSLTWWTEFEQTPGDNGEQSDLVCCSPRGHKEMWPNNNNGKIGCMPGGTRVHRFLFFFSVHTITFFVGVLIGLAQDSFSSSEGCDFVFLTTIHSSNWYDYLTHNIASSHSVIRTFVWAGEGWKQLGTTAASPVFLPPNQSFGCGLW